MRSMFLALVLSLSVAACATAPRPTVVVESVGTLAPSYHSIAVAPVAMSTDLSPGFQAVSSDADADASSFATSTEAAKQEAPEAVAKAGLTVGRAR